MLSSTRTDAIEFLLNNATSVVVSVATKVKVLVPVVTDVGVITSTPSNETL